MQLFALVGSVAGFGAHKSQAHLPLSPSLPPLPPQQLPNHVAYQGVVPVSYAQISELGGDETASVGAAILASHASGVEPFHEWNVAHPREGLSYFDCPDGFEFKAASRTCVMIHYSAPTESCPYGAYRDKITKHCITTDSVAPDRTCPPGFAYFMRGCIRRTQVEPLLSCSAGYSQVGNQCVSVAQVPAHARCPDGTYFDPTNSTCLRDIVSPPTFTCPQDTVTLPMTLMLSDGTEVESIQYIFVKTNDTNVSSTEDETPTLRSLRSNSIETSWRGLAATAKNSTRKTSTVTKKEKKDVEEEQEADKEENEDEAVTDLEADLLIPTEDPSTIYIARPSCTQTTTQTSQMCPSGFSLRSANLVLAEIIAAFDSATMPTHLVEAMDFIATLPSDTLICERLEMISGSLSCPLGYTLSTDLISNPVLPRNQKWESATQQFNTRVCVLSLRALHEDQRRKGRRETTFDTLPDSDGESMSVRFLNEVFGRKLTGSTVVAEKVFATHPHCSTKRDDELRWNNGNPVCVEAAIMKPYVACKAGVVFCRSAAGDALAGSCLDGTVVCDTAHTISQPATVACPEDWLHLVTPLQDSRTNLTALVPVCRSAEPVEPLLNCPFDVGTPDVDLQCQALSVSDLMFTCPEGYTKGTSERAKKDMQRNSKRSPSPLLPPETINICELLEYAEYQVTCPVGYERERARNTYHACVAEKPTIPTLMCPAGFMPATDLLDLLNEKACIKTVEIAPALLSPASPFEGIIEDPHHAKKGDYTACTLTKNGALSCGSERKYHAETNLAMQEKWGLKYQEKYERKNAKKLEKREKDELVR